MAKKRILTVIGARPQFVKAAAVSRRLRDPAYAEFEEALVHTGQHFDEGMSGSFFRDLEIPEPRWNLGAGGGSHGAQTGAMISGLEQVIASWPPDVMLIYGDTNSTLAGALAAAKAGIRIAHVEAGLRSFRRAMPEEVNRVVTDRLSDFLFCPTETAVKNLAAENRFSGVHHVGDVMYDTFLRERARLDPTVLDRLALAPGCYVLATIHRAENTDEPERLSTIITELTKVAHELPVVIPMHPRTRRALDAMDLSLCKTLTVLEPQCYPAMLALLCNAAVVATDSGGLQKEAYFAAVPCVTLRDETEWTETVTSGWNTLAPPSARGAAALIRKASECKPSSPPPTVYGSGDAARAILDILARER